MLMKGRIVEIHPNCLDSKRHISYKALLEVDLIPTNNMELKNVRTMLAGDEIEIPGIEMSLNESVQPELPFTKE